jgi:hypothetical protein
MENKNEKLIQGLRDMADWLEAHPGTPHVSSNGSFYIFLRGANAKEQLAKFARDAAPVEKSSSGDYFNIDRQFGGKINLQATSKHDLICERIVTKKIVPERVLPAREEETIPEHEEEVISWSCPESLLAPDMHDGSTIDSLIETVEGVKP